MVCRNRLKGRRMLAGIFGKKSDHPLADAKSVQELLENLPKNDAHKSLMELTELIESVTRNTEFKLDHQFAVLRMIDEAAQPYARKLAREYFTPFEINKFQENRLWLVLGNYFRQVANAYYAAFNRFCSAEKGSNTIKLLPALVINQSDCDWIINAFDAVIASAHRVPGAVWSLGKTLVNNAVRAHAAR